MSQEKRVWLAAILSSLVLVAYSQILSKTTAPHPQPIPPTAAVPLPSKAQESQIETHAQLIRAEEVIELNSSQLLLALGKESRAVRAVTLKDYENILTKEPLNFGNRGPILSVLVGGVSGSWSPAEIRQAMASWSFKQESGISGELAIEMEQAKPTYTVRLLLKNEAGQPQRIPVKLTASWKRADEISGSYNLLEAVLFAQKTAQWQRTHLTYRDGTSQIKRVPRGTSLITLSERFFCQSIKFESDAPVSASLLPAEKGELAVLAESEIAIGPNESATYSVTVYTGPRDFFRLRDAGFEEAFPRGLLAKIGLFLMFMLKLIASVVKNYGTAVILLAASVTAVLSPFTIVSVRSMKKMQELQPKMEQIKAKYAGDPQRINKETLAIFKEHKVSPLSGCLPMFMQLPIFFALWSAISHAIELRGERLLWIKDLSLPDRLAKLPIGLDLNLLPILMAVAMYVQTKLSQPKTKTQTASMLSGPMMPVLFGVMFYQVPSGLVLYWLTNSLTSIAWYRLAKV